MKGRGLFALLAAAMLFTCMAGALAEETGSCETHSWSNGVCTVCGYECPHTERKQTGGDQENKTIVDNKDGTHTRSFDVIHLYTCTACGDVERRYIERGSETEEHHWKSDNTCADGCGAVKPCEHTWSNGVCTVCGYECPHTERRQTGGDQENKTVEDNKDGTHTRSFDVIHLYTCTACGDVERRYIERGSETEEHRWKSDNTCAECGAAKPHEHTWSNGQCTGCGEVCNHDWSDGVCTVCGDACVHDWKAATCTEPKTCSVCNVTEGSANGHSWQDATCTAPKTCSVCGVTEGEANGHSWQDATCTTPRTCSVCNATEGGTLPHSWNDGTCSACGASCPGHDYQQTGTTSETSYEQWNDTQHKAKIAVFKTMTCSTCGHSTQESGGEQEEFQNHKWANGKCTACGYVCQHPFSMLIKPPKDTREEALPSVPENENTHTDYYIVHEVFDCACGLEFEPPTEPKSVPGKAHAFDGNDVCTACGYKKGDIVCDHVWTDATCTAPQTCSKCNTTVGEPKGHSWSNGECSVCGEPCSHDWSEATCTAPKTCGICGVTDGSALGHSWKDATCTAPKTCGRCGLTEGEAKGHDWSNKDGVCANHCGETCEHSWSDGECTKCGYACGHDWSNRNGVCAICNMTCEHSWSDGGCTVCGYGCSHDWSNQNGVCRICDEVCKHPEAMRTLNDKKSWDDIVTATADDDATHTYSYTHHDVYDCACGISEVYDDAYGVTIPGQPHEYVDGKCEECDHVCKHPQSMLTYNAQKSWDEPLKSVADDDSTHTDHYIIHDVFDCACGKEFVPPASEGSAKGKPHSYADGVCADCGHVCTHSSIEKDGEAIRTDGEAEYFNEDVHIQHYTTEQKMKCAHCGSRMESILGGGRDGSVLHVYVNDVCVCGAQKPAAPADDGGSTGGGNGGNGGGNYTGVVQEPEADEEIVFEQVEPEPKPAMVEKLVETVAQAEASGSEVKVEVVGAQQVMTETEYAQLKTLPVQEQILVTLASIGFEEVVSAAVETMNNVELSDDALKLMDTVSARMTAASAEEREQMETKLAKYFPVREIEVGGVTYPYFVMELQIEVDGELTIQRYGFRMDENGEWVFVMLSEL